MFWLRFSIVILERALIHSFIRSSQTKWLTSCDRGDYILAMQLWHRMKIDVRLKVVILSAFSRIFCTNKIVNSTGTLSAKLGFFILHLINSNIEVKSSGYLNIHGNTAFDIKTDPGPYYWKQGIPHWLFPWKFSQFNGLFWNISIIICFFFWKIPGFYSLVFFSHISFLKS